MNERDHLSQFKRHQWREFLATEELQDKFKLPLFVLEDMQSLLYLKISKF